MNKWVQQSKDLILLPIVAVFAYLCWVFGTEAMGYVLAIVSLAVGLPACFYFMRNQNEAPPVPGLTRAVAGLGLIGILAIYAYKLRIAIAQGHAGAEVIIVLYALLTILILGVGYDILGLRRRR